MKTTTEIKNKIRITAKKAAILAMKELKGLPKYSDVKNLLLEEIELSKDKSFWNITLSFDPILPKKDGLELIADGIKLMGTKLTDIKYDPARIFMLVVINSRTGEFQSMKHRKVA